MNAKSLLTRRQVIQAAGSAALLSLAGCLGSSNDQYDELKGPVPEPYRTATSIGGMERNPEQVQPKSAVNYGEERGSQACKNCVYYIRDKNNDDLGACSVVEGYIEPDGWCTTYAKDSE